MTLENKIVNNYFIGDTNFSSDNPQIFAEIHIDNPLGMKIKGISNCKICKGKGYIKCRSGKHEKACKVCLSKHMEIERLKLNK